MRFQRRAAPWLIAAAIPVMAGCGDPPFGTGPDDTPRLDLIIPIAGVMNGDWYLTNYVDLVAGSGIGDYACGVKSYNGHQGVDMVLPDFEAMDAGVAVLAAASGTVTHTHDGEYDRNKAWGQGDQWNAVYIDHGDGYQAWYGHLRAGSLRVSTGQAVSAGDTLGLVGSSGRSDMPHLHFELRRDGAWVDPFSGDCGPATSQWASQLPYQDVFRLIRSGVTLDPLTLDRVKDPPTPAETVVQGTGTLHVWVHYHNVRQGSRTRWTIRRPDGSVHRDFDATHGSFYSMSWWWYFTALDDFQPAGTWTVEIRNDDVLLDTRTFQVLASAPAPRDAAAAPPPAPEHAGIVHGWGGGALR